MPSFYIFGIGGNLRMGRKTKMNSITSPELLAQVNPMNQQLLDEFCEYLRSVQRSELTIHGYVNDIQIAFIWNLLHNNNAFYCDWTKRQVVKYQNWLINEHQNSPARIRRLRSALSSLGNFVESVLDEEYPDFRNIINKIEAPVNRPVREKTVWTDDELESLLERLTIKEDYEKACYLALAMYSGRRKSELCRFKVTDFTKEKLVCGGALYKSAPIKTKGAGGGKHINCYTLAKKFDPYLHKWMKYREEHNIDSEWLFPKKDCPTEHVSISTINSWSNTFSRLSGRPAYIHSLRHYFTTSLAKAGIPDGVIQSIIAWESSDMVRLYTDLDADEQIGMYFKDGDIFIPEKKGLNDI